MVGTQWTLNKDGIWQPNTDYEDFWHPKKDQQTITVIMGKIGVGKTLVTRSLKHMAGDADHLRNDELRKIKENRNFILLSDLKLTGLTLEQLVGILPQINERIKEYNTPEYDKMADELKKTNPDAFYSDDAMDRVYFLLLSEIDKRLRNKDEILPKIPRNILADAQFNKINYVNNVIGLGMYHDAFVMTLKVLCDEDKRLERLLIRDQGKNPAQKSEDRKSVV